MAIIVLAEDEFLLRWSLKRALEQKGFEVLTTESGRQALILLASHPVTCLICDHRLPDMEGIEVLERAKKLHPDVVYILITAYSTPELEVKATSLGIHYLPKPFTLEDLVQRLPLPIS